MTEIIDQSLHLLWSLVALSPLIVERSVRAFVFAAVIWALPREFVDQWHWPFGCGKILDLLFFAVGGLIAGLIWKNTTQESEAEKHQ
jgi:hypothetical protein